VTTTATNPDATALDVADLTVDFGGLRALDDVSIRVLQGQTCGLIGPNGAGKTTLFDSVLGVLQTTTGSVELFGQDVSGLAVHRRARLGLGRTFQRLELFGSLTVLENMIVAIESISSVVGIANELLRRPTSIDVRRRAHGRADELLELVGLVGLAETRAADLSIGHARLLELARALAAEPKLLMLDEVSSGLNESETAQLSDLIGKLRDENGLSLLIVEHDMDFVLGLSGFVYVLDFGKLIAAGTPKEIRGDPVVRAAYLGQDAPAGAPKKGAPASARKKDAPTTKKPTKKRKARAAPPRR
jgi:branched-chain amino acid transport system ATP-binding protein